MHRRHFLIAATSTALVPLAACVQAAQGFEVTRSADQWRDILGPREFAVMREEATERAFSSPLNKVNAEGIYHCKGCDQALYSSRTKFESGTGWPSFWAPLDDAVATKLDPGIFRDRTEVHCDRCGSHMGHVFNDGPEPTGKRHCINGISMVFRPADGGAPISG